MSFVKRTEYQPKQRRNPLSAGDDRPALMRQVGKGDDMMKKPDKKGSRNPDRHLAASLPKSKFTLPYLNGIVKKGL